MSDQASLGDISESNTKEETSEDSEEYFRFPIPTEWEVRPMSRIGNVQGGSTPETGKEEYWDGDIPWLTPTEVTENRKIEISETNRNITEEGYESTSTHLMPENSLLLTTRATIGSALINKVPMCTNQGFQNIEPKDDVNTLYLYYQVRYAADYLDSLGSGSTFNEISKSMLKNVELPVPEKDEQRRIASVLYNVDQAIQKTEEIIEQTQRVKKGLMQDLFTEGYFEHQKFEEHHTLGRYPASWDIKQVEEIGQVNPESFSAEEYEEEKFDYITLTNVSEGQILEIEETPTDEAPSRAKRKVRSGDVLIGTVRPKQRSHAKVSEEYNGNVCSTGFSVIRTKEMNSDYLSQEIFTHRFFSQMQAYVAGSGYPAVTNSDVKKMRVAVPPKEEQNKIAEVLKEHDEEIENLEMEKKQLQRLKKGLMQDLLTGEVRTGSDVGVLDAVVGVETDE
jgi:type I restriction enzyme S subunit